MIARAVASRRALQNQGCARGYLNLGCLAVYTSVLVVMGLLALGFVIALVV